MTLTIPDLDIWRTANVLIKQHGEEAPIHAAMRADELLDKGDLEGCAVWKRVIKAVEEMLSKERPPAPICIAPKRAVLVFAMDRL